MSPSLHRIVLSLAVTFTCTVGGIDGADAQRASSSKAASKGAPTSNETDRVLDGAAKSLESGNADAAMTALDGVLKGGGLSNNYMARALYLRGLAHRKKGRPAQAIADLTSAIWLKDGLNEKDRVAALSARSEVSREVGVAAPAAGSSGSAASTSAAAEVTPAAPEAASSSGTTARTSRSMRDALSEAGFTRRFSAPASTPTPAPEQHAARDEPRTGPVTSSWQSGTTVDPKEHRRTEAPRRQVSAAEPPAPTGGSPAAQPSSGGGFGSFFSGLFSGTPSSTPPSGDAGGKSQWRPRADQSATNEKVADRKGDVDRKAGKDAEPISTSAVKSGAYRLQIATVRNRKEADAVAARVRKEHARAIDGRRLEIDETVFGGMGTFYRVRLGPYADVKEPKSLCDQHLRPKGFDCLVVTN